MRIETDKLVWNEGKLALDACKLGLDEDKLGLDEYKLVWNADKVMRKENEGYKGRLLSVRKFGKWNYLY